MLPSMALTGGKLKPVKAGSDLYIVLAQWDMTEVERMVMASVIRER